MNDKKTQDFENIFDAIIYNQELDRCIRWDFATTPIYKAIESHLLKNPCYLADKPEGLAIRSYKGTGPAISIERLVAGISGDGLSLTISVNYNSSPDEPSYYEYSPCDPGITQEYRMYIPKDLIINFTKEKFQVWLQEMKQKQEERKIEKVIKWCKKDRELIELALSMIDEEKRNSG